MSSEDFDAGDAVILHSLRQATHLNGCRAVVHEYQGANSGRFKVKLDDRDMSPAQQLMGPMPAVLPRNMTLDYAAGTKAVLRNLVRAAHLNGKVVTVAQFCQRRGRFIVELPAEAEEEGGGNNSNDDEGGGVRVNALDASVNKDVNLGVGGDETASSPSLKKARPNTPKPPTLQVVKPANLTHLPGCRPAPTPVCEQRLIFTGSMASITKVLDHSPHRPNNGPFATNGGSSNRYGLLSDASMNGMDSMNTAHAAMEQINEFMSALRLWAKIKARSYVASKAPNGQSSGGIPPFYQKLVRVADEHIHKICFNPKCRRHILPCTQTKMKRCINW